MENILLASSDRDQVEQIRERLAAEFNITTLTSPDEYNGNSSDYGLVLIDQNFSDDNGLDFLSSVLTDNYLPSIFLSSPDDPKYAAEAVNAGAFSYIIKADNFLDFLGFTISDCIQRFYENSRLKNTILAMNRKVKVLERRLAQPAGAAATTDIDPWTKLVEDIKYVMANGELYLPNYPQISTRFRAAANSGASIKEITAFLVRDPGISSKLIGISNSPYYKGMLTIKTLEQAISRIGISETSKYVDVIANRALYTAGNSKYKKYLSDLWQHSLACAFFCQEICRLLMRGNPAELFALGLFHDIGKLLLVQIISELESNGAYAEGISEKTHLQLADKIQGKLGASLMQKWNLSKEYADIARWHEQLNAPFQTDELYIVNLANILAIDMGYTEKTADGAEIKECVSLQKLNLTMGDVNRIKNKVDELMKVGV